MDYRHDSTNELAAFLSQLSRNSKDESGLISSTTSPGDDIFEKELLAMFEYLTSMESKDFDQKTLKLGKAISGTLLSWRIRCFDKQEQFHGPWRT